MVLTDLGRRIAPRVTEAFIALGEAFAIARTESASILAITAPRTFATNWLAGRLGEFNIICPDLAVRLDMSDEMVDLASSEFDVAIRGMRPPVPPGMVAHFLMRMPVTPLVNPSFLANHPLETPADLRSSVRISPEDDWWDLWFESLDVGARDGGGSRTGIRFESQVLDGHAAIAGHGVAILSPPMFQPAIDAGLLVQPFPHVATYPNAFWLVYPEHKRNMAKIRALRDWLLDAVKRAVGDDPYGILVPPPDPASDAVG
jgi:LysR family glycine cleavage system transcriptional activator